MSQACSIMRRSINPLAALISTNRLNGGPIFGPDSWRGDALVAGYSRGKLYRTRLVQTAVGYVAQTHLLGAVQSLLVDACVLPSRAIGPFPRTAARLIGVAVPGKGNLYQVSYVKSGLSPIKSALWPASPTETILEFDRALEAACLTNLLKQIKVTEGRYVGAGIVSKSCVPATRLSKTSSRSRGSNWKFIQRCLCRQPAPHFTDSNRGRRR
jgi:hypothetical protein